MFSHLASYDDLNYALTNPERSEPLEAIAFTGDLFGVLGVQPLLGRTFGCLMEGEGLASAGQRGLRSAKPAGRHHVRIVAWTAQTATPPGNLATQTRPPSTGSAPWCCAWNTCDAICWASRTKQVEHRERAYRHHRP